MLKYDLDTRIPYSADEYREKRKTRREEFAMAIMVQDALTIMKTEECLYLTLILNQEQI